MILKNIAKASEEGDAGKEGHYIIDCKGKRIGIILDINIYKNLLEAKEELEAIKAYDEAIASDDEVIPFEQAIMEIEEGKI